MSDSSITELPSSILGHICQYTESSDLLHLRSTSKRMHEFLSSNSDDGCMEGDMVWRYALARDFSFGILSTNNDSEVHYLQTLGIRSAQHDDDDDDDGATSSSSSIFGYSLTDDKSVFTAKSAFESWRHWSKASRIYFQDLRANPDPDDDTAKTNKNTKINGPYFLRAAHMWKSIAMWCMDENSSGSFGKNLLKTLVPGVSHQKGRFSSLRSSMKRADYGVHSLEAVFAFCDGQKNLTEAERIGADKRLAFFGGYSAYDHSNYMRLCATLDSSHVTFQAREINPDDPMTVISWNYSNPWKFIGIGNNDGFMKLQAMSKKRTLAYPSSNNSDTGLCWFEEFARRLKCKEMEISSCDQDQIFLNPRHGTDSFGILSQFPSACSTNLCSRKVTRGIEVIASGIGAPEIQSVIYSIRIRLLMESEEGHMTEQERGFETCQLQSRHWVLYNEDNDRTESVDGNGVVGLYPVLFEGGYRDDRQNMSGQVRKGDNVNGLFQYQSCAGLTRGTFKGSLKFVPGSIKEPKGEPLIVELGEFPIRLVNDVHY